MNRTILVIFMCFVGLSGCSLLKNSQGTASPLQQQQDIRFFVKTATRIALYEIRPEKQDVEVIKAYIVAGRDLLSEEGPDLEGLRELAENLLPEQHKVLGLTILDVIERYVLSVLPDPDQESAKAMKLIAFGFEGALLALDEYFGG